MSLECIVRSPFGILFSKKCLKISFCSETEGQIEILKDFEDSCFRFTPGFFKILDYKNLEKKFYCGSGILKVENQRVQISSFPIFDEHSDLENYLRDFAQDVSFYQKKCASAWDFV